jgi:alpha-L-rhamnosidase
VPYQPTHPRPAAEHMSRVLLLVTVALAWRGGALAQRPGPGSGDPTCSTGEEGVTLDLSCPATAVSETSVITDVKFALYGSVSGTCQSALGKGDCGADITAHMKAACVGRSSCTVHCSHKDEGCVQGKGPTCGCAFTSGPSKVAAPFMAIPDPCPGKSKSQGVRVLCNGTSHGPGGGSAKPSLDNLRVNMLNDPLVIDDPRPFFSWKVNGAGGRGVVSEAYEIVLRLGSAGRIIWASGKVGSNRTSYVPLGRPAQNLTSDTQYSWAVRGWVVSAASAAAAVPTAWSNATFSTALMEQSDWNSAQWITSPGGDSPGQFSSQMRKMFTLAAGAVARGRLFLALPGYGQVFLNGHRVDDPETGSRSLSQYDYRMLYHTYDCTNLLRPGKNVLAIYVGLGWWGHPAVPPQAKRFPYGPPTLRALLRVHSGAAPVVEVGTDATWEQTQGPIIYDDEYNGETWDARKETPGWTSDTVEYSTARSGGTNGSSLWTGVVLAASQPQFTLNHTLMSSAAFQPIRAIKHRIAEQMRSPAPGVYVYDFGQNEPGWCKLALDSCEAGLVVQLRHAEVLQHPPYGPIDGNIYVGNLRSAKATDIYVCKGDPTGESVSFSFTQHGFRYVELTFPGSKAPAPTLETLTAVYTRSSVELAGDLTFSDDLLNKVHHNYLWGQASNL